MNYILYIILLYLIIPFNLHVDAITILLFFIALNEDERFCLIFSFFAGLLIDLYYPAVLGINALIFIVLVQTLLYVKKYIARTAVVRIGLFAIFYLARVILTHATVSFPISFYNIILTIICFFPMYAILSKVISKTWTKV